MKEENYEEMENDEELSEEDQGFIDETEEYFTTVWKDLKGESKDLSKKELAQKMFVLGAVLCRKNMDHHLDNLMHMAKNKPEEFQKMLEEESEDDLWEEGSFAETLSPESEAKMRTFHMKHNEEMNYHCSKCDSLMSAHNKDWHNGMCDQCFDKEVYHQ